MSICTIFSIFSIPFFYLLSCYLSLTLFLFLWTFYFSWYPKDCQLCIVSTIAHKHHFETDSYFQNYKELLNLDQVLFSLKSIKTFWPFACVFHIQFFTNPTHTNTYSTTYFVHSNLFVCFNTIGLYTQWDFVSLMCFLFRLTSICIFCYLYLHFCCLQTSYYSKFVFLIEKIIRKC